MHNVEFSESARLGTIRASQRLSVADQAEVQGPFGSHDGSFENRARLTPSH